MVACGSNDLTRTNDWEVVGALDQAMASAVEGITHLGCTPSDSIYAGVYSIRVPSGGRANFACPGANRDSVRRALITFVKLLEQGGHAASMMAIGPGDAGWEDPPPGSGSGHWVGEWFETHYMSCDVTYDSVVATPVSDEEYIWVSFFSSSNCLTIYGYHMYWIRDVMEEETPGDGGDPGDTLPPPPQESWTDEDGYTCWQSNPFCRKPLTVQDHLLISYVKDFLKSTDNMPPADSAFCTLVNNKLNSLMASNDVSRGKANTGWSEQMPWNDDHVANSSSFNTGFHIDPGNILVAMNGNQIDKLYFLNYLLHESYHNIPGVNDAHGAAVNGHYEAPGWSNLDFGPGNKCINWPS